ncbi:MAG TPA: ATP-binding protein [Acidimicrobiales bacterium]|nr:ATP-binding protein [Acidimicrobiales bacterium]
MELDLQLRLPNEEATLPVVRHVARSLLRDLGVSEEMAGDLELAVGEACANVVRHSDSDGSYLVEFGLRPPDCTIRVVDHGRGFEPSSLPRGQPDPVAEHGRGISIMRGLVDRIELESRPAGGTVVCLAKNLGPPEA